MIQPDYTLTSNRPAVHLFYPIILILIIIAVSISVVYMTNNPISQGSYVADKGCMDLRGWDSEEVKYINLDGEWEFYPGALLSPDEINEDGASLSKKYIHVPGHWGKYIGDNGSMEGAGTYRLRILVPADGSYAVKTRTIRLASKVYLNGQEITSTGNPSAVREDFKGESSYSFGGGSSLDREIDLVVQVASYGYRTGGITGPIEFGTFGSIMVRNNEAFVIDAIGIVACLIVGIFFFILYWQRKKESYLLYFSLTNLVMALYLSTMNEQLLHLLVSYDLVYRTKIQIITMLATSIGLLQFVALFLKDYSNQKTVRLLTCICLPLFLLAFINIWSLSPLLVNALQGTVMAGVILCYTKIFYILLKAIVAKTDTLEYLIVIASSLILYWLLIFVKTLFEIYLGNIQVVLILFMLIGAASLITHRFNLDYKEASALTERLIRYDRQKDDFLAKVSHELKTPLYIMLGLTRNLMEGRKGFLNPSQQEDLLFIHIEAQRLTRLVVDLLSATRMKDSKTTLRIIAMDPFKITDDILQEMKALIPGDKQIRLKNLIPKDFPKIKGDPDKFRQIIYNLIHNGIKFTNEGEITVSAAVADKEIEFKVSDTGKGIKGGHLQDVFHIFYQRDESPKSMPGLGLGLAIVKQLVEEQGGGISVDSIYGRGTTFTFTLPQYYGGEDGDYREERVFLQNVQEVFPEIKKTTDLETSGQRILIVDDEPLNQKILMNTVREMGWDVVLAQNGAEALATIKDVPLDLVILDYMLQDMPGDKICREIRKHYSMAELPILILTASESTADLLKGFEHEANDFQRKPIDPSELVSRIQSLLLMKGTVEKGLEREFKYFYAQISPHFLYNTINTIIGLSYTDNEKARKALTNLSIYFRGKLEIHSEKGLIPLEKELELVVAYLEIEEMRYGDKLSLVFDLEEGLRAMIPPLTLQPIVENAVHYGVRAKGKGTIKISGKRDGKGFIIITIEDDGIGMDATKQAGLLKGHSSRIGFKNVRGKIQALRKADISLESIVGQGTKVEIILPEGGM